MNMTNSRNTKFDPLFKILKESQVNLLYTSDSYMLTLANCEDPDEIPHNVTFHQGLHCLPRRNQS